MDKIACERISGIIRSLKTFARVNESDLRKVDINDLLRNTIKLTSSGIPAADHVRDGVRRAAGSGMLSGAAEPGVSQPDRERAARPLTDEGTVTVRTRPDGRFVDIALSDTGTGIPPEVRPKIFAAGFTTKPLGEGTGLGLTITREIVEDTHGGKISFETEVGQGHHLSRSYPD